MRGLSKHSKGTMPRSPLPFMHNAHPSSYSATTVTVWPVLIESSSGRVGMKVHFTIASEVAAAVARDMPTAAPLIPGASEGGIPLGGAMLL